MTVPELIRVSAAAVPIRSHSPQGGLTCNEEHLPTKGGALRLAAELGLALVACDTSPRAKRYPGDDESWDFGQGAGFYIDATEAPWSESYRMETHVTKELPAWVEESFPAVTNAKRGIFGHSMDGHGLQRCSCIDGQAWTSAMRAERRLAPVTRSALSAARASIAAEQGANAPRSEHRRARVTRSSWSTVLRRRLRQDEQGLAEDRLDGSGLHVVVRR
ncbi:MAG: hypothetical protein BGO98_04570 [Myxococcales bacterium 68-20]|nr:MAG: hypothetical protein BGO98_04570 [Myxococcales bacterium 68-20]